MVTLSQTLCQLDGKDVNSISPGLPGNRKICCNCRKSRCLKLYCECFLNKRYCFGCKCVNCLNQQEFESDRERAMQATLVRNPTAFVPKISASEPEEIPQNSQYIETDLNFNSKEPLLRHTRGCHCKKSNCLKKYCECYQIGAKCTALCKCNGCHNCGGVEFCKKSRITRRTQAIPKKVKIIENEENIQEIIEENNKIIEINKPFAVTKIANKKELFKTIKKKKPTCYKVRIGTSHFVFEKQNKDENQLINKQSAIGIN